MREATQTRPVYRTLNKPMTLLGVERRLFFFLLLACFLLFHLTEALLPALLPFGVLWTCAKAATQYDPQILRIVVNSSRFGVRYDPALKESRHRGLS